MMQVWTTPKQRRSYNMANWDAIREMVQEALRTPPNIESTDELEQAASQLETAVQQALEKNIPIPRAFPYPKRWWTRELTDLRKEYNFQRNQRTQAVRRGDFNKGIQRAALQANRNYLSAIANQKKTHWKEFLDDQQNVWKALRALEGQDKSWTIPPLKTASGLTDEADEKAREDLRDPVGGLIREEEVKRAIFSSNSRRAAGPDDIPFRVWQEIWRVIGKRITRLYHKSVLIQHIPRAWAEAKIVIIPKPGKPDYSVPKAYRPISLLRTISKGLKRLIAQRLSEFCERTKRLSATQFEARPRRSTEQALVILVDKTYEAWRKQK
ncbi:hypothetical protein V501_01420, partial [Pseudogymnoascus sp. VKM F-4519 (FW-2642)]